MKTSASNQFLGIITSIYEGSVNTEIVLNIGANQTLVAMITQDSVKRLDLEVNTTCTALVTASTVMLSSDTNVVTSARNKLIGTISRLVVGAVNTDVTIDIGNHLFVCAMVTNDSAMTLGLKEGSVACALFNASSVLIMIE